MEEEVEAATPMEQDDGGAAEEAAVDRKRRLELGMEEYVERYFYQYRDPRMPSIVSLNKHSEPAAASPTVDRMAEEMGGPPQHQEAEQRQQQEQQQAESSSSSSDEDETLQQDRRRTMLIARQMTLRTNLLRQVATLPLRPMDPAIPNASRALRDVLRRMSDVDVLTHHLLETSRQQLRTRSNLLESSGEDVVRQQPGRRQHHHQDPHHH